MKIDVSTLLTRLAERAKTHQEQLQICLKHGHEQLGRALSREGRANVFGDDTESVDWTLKAQVHRAKLSETQALIEVITHSLTTAAQAGRSEA